MLKPFGHRRIYRQSGDVSLYLARRGLNVLSLRTRSHLIARTMAGGVMITATPSKARIVDDILVKVQGLKPGEKVTLTSRLTESEKVWTSHAHYTAGQDGSVDVTQAPSEGGVYKGVDPMGLFSDISVAGEPQARLLKRNISSPIVTTLSVVSGHVSSEQLREQEPVTHTTVERYFQVEDVVRTPVREGRIRGTLFTPKGSPNQKYPGIIDLYGTTGGLLETRAALLASYGFATLALAYFNYEDLPKPLEPIDLEYFEEAVNWFDSHTNIIPNNMGVIGVSKGGEMALHISTLTEKVKAVVAINSYFYNSTIAHTYKGKKIPCIFPDMAYAKKQGDWFILEDSYDKVENIEECYIPVEKSNSAEFLLIHGADDRLILPYNGMRLARRLWDHGRDNVTLHIYPGTGHLIEPRYSPVCTGVHHKVLGSLLLCGGSKVEHARAQKESWEQILHFFNRKLVLPSSQL